MSRRLRVFRSWSSASGLWLLRSSSAPLYHSPVSPNLNRVSSRDSTYARELDTAVTALGGSAALLDVQDPGVTTGRLDDACPVGGGVVAAKESNVSPLLHDDSLGDTEGLVRLTGSGDGRRHEWEPLLRFVVSVVEVFNTGLAGR